MQHFSAKVLAMMGCLLMQTVSANPLTVTPATTTPSPSVPTLPPNPTGLLAKPRQAAAFPMEATWVFLTTSSTTYFGAPSSTNAPEYGASYTSAISSACAIAYGSITASPDAVGVAASFIETNNNIETVAACIVDTVGAQRLEDTADDDTWRQILDETLEADIDYLGLPGRAYYTIARDGGDDMTTSVGYVDLFIQTATVDP